MTLNLAVPFWEPGGRYGVVMAADRLAQVHGDEVSKYRMDSRSVALLCGTLRMLEDETAQQAVERHFDSLLTRRIPALYDLQDVVRALVAREHAGGVLLETIAWASGGWHRAAVARLGPAAPQLPFSPYASSAAGVLPLWEEAAYPSEVRSLDLALRFYEEFSGAMRYRGLDVFQVAPGRTDRLLALPF